VCFVVRVILVCFVVRVIFVRFVVHWLVVCVVHRSFVVQQKSRRGSFEPAGTMIACVFFWNQRERIQAPTRPVRFRPAHFFPVSELKRMRPAVYHEVYLKAES